VTGRQASIRFGAIVQTSRAGVVSDLACLACLGDWSLESLETEWSACLSGRVAWWNVHTLLKPPATKTGDCLGETDKGPRAGQGRAGQGSGSRYLWEPAG
jgi:hypothetical protein